MKDLAPDIFRQRLLLEGFYTIEVDEETITAYFHEITRVLNLDMYARPIIFSPESMGQEENQGYDAFAPLIDSGISVYIWSYAEFLSVLFFTCKGFDERHAVEVTRDFFQMPEVQYQGF